MISEIKHSKVTPACSHSRCKVTGTEAASAGGGEEEVGFMVCSVCKLFFCARWSNPDMYSPQGHARRHAEQCGHGVALWFDEQGYDAYCFHCEEEYSFLLYLDDILISEGGSRLNQNGKGLRGMAVDNDAGGHAFGLTNADDFVIRGMENLGDTCYMNALLQCLLALGKLRTRMLGQDAPLGRLGRSLRTLFETTSSAYDNAMRVLNGDAIRVLRPDDLLKCIRDEDSQFVGNNMQDSHELFLSLCRSLDKEELYKQEEDANSALVSTITDSIFRGSLYPTISRKCCSPDSAPLEPFSDISVALPSKDRPATSVASPTRNKSHLSPRTELFQTTDKSNAEKIQTLARGGDFHSPGSELGYVVVEKTPKPFEFDSIGTVQILQSKDGLHGRLQATKDDVLGDTIEAVNLLPPLFDDEVEEMAEAERTSDPHSYEATGLRPLPPRKKDKRTSSGSHIKENDHAGFRDIFSEPNVIIGGKDNTCPEQVSIQDEGKAQSSETVYDETSIEECLALFFGKEKIESRCKDCSKVAEQPSTNGSHDEERMMETTNVNTTIDGDHTEQSVRKTHQNGCHEPEKGSASCSTDYEEHECHQVVQEAVPSCLPAEKQTNMLSAQDSQNASTLNQRRGKQVKLDQVEENQSTQEDRNGRAVRRYSIWELPRVLTIHLKRYTRHEGTSVVKMRGHVRFKEILDVGRFMHPSSEDKDNSSYHLVGVIEHRGTGMEDGHYVAYVRTKKQALHGIVQAMPSLKKLP